MIVDRSEKGLETATHFVILSGLKAGDSGWMAHAATDTEGSCFPEGPDCASLHRRSRPRRREGVLGRVHVGI
jgi:hypothetical protein